jgi:hypothetical protein
MKRHFYRIFIFFLLITLFSILLDFFYYKLNIDKSLSKNINTIHWKIIGTIISYFIFNGKNIFKRKNSKV